MGDFQGFPKDTVPFLRDLTAHNDKEWFDANRDRYEGAFLDPAKAFVTAMAPKIEAISATAHAEPAVNKTIMRINRDTRFSKDKTPYKNHLDLMFWDGEGRSRECAGFFLRIDPEKLHLGAGKHGFSSEELELWRSAVQSKKGEELQRIIDDLAAKGWEIGGAHYKSVPRGLPKDHPRADLLKFNALHAFTNEKHPKELTKPAIVDFCAERFRTGAPLLFWVRDHVVEAAKK